MPSDFHKPSVTLIAVDPGLRGSGLAIYRGGVLHHAEYVKNPDEFNRGPVAHSSMADRLYHVAYMPHSDVRNTHLIVEFPQIYSGPGKGADPNDLLDIAGVASATVQVFTECILSANLRWVKPFEWKGNIKKQIMTDRILASLTDGERAVIVSSGSKDHNTVDAAGLGLHQLGRLNRRILT